MEIDLIEWREVLLLFVGLALGYLLSLLFRRRQAARGDQAGTAKATENEGDSASVASFGQQLAEQLARYDLELEVSKLREDVAKLREEVAELRAARNVSPQYAEALGLARRGLSAQQIADRMGISLAEAELVHALSRGEELFKEPGFDELDRPPR